MSNEHLFSDTDTNLVCLHRKVWMGNGIPFPHSGSFSSRLFLLTIFPFLFLWRSSRVLLLLLLPLLLLLLLLRHRDAAAGSAQVTGSACSAASRHDWLRPCVKMAASVGRSVLIQRDRSSRRGKRRRKMGEGG